MMSLGLKAEGMLIIVIVLSTSDVLGTILDSLSPEQFKSEPKKDKTRCIGRCRAML